MLHDSLINELLSQIWFHFALVALFGFLTGLEFREYILLRGRERPEIPAVSLGTARTFTFIAILGFVLHRLDPDLRLYLVGMGGLILFLGLFYHHKLKSGQTGLLQLLMMLIVYAYGPTIALLPPWFLVLLFVAVVFTLSARPFAHRVIERLEPQEIPTLAKFLLLSGVILPLLPDQPISRFISATPFRIWLAVVVISAISYAGYILRKYLLHRQGYLVTGLLGGLYSSTATTVVLARKSHALGQRDLSLDAGIMAASGMMYLRLLMLVLIMNPGLLPHTLWPLLLFGLGSVAVALLVDRKGAREAQPATDLGRSNPLELGVALLFAVLFVVMMVITQQVIDHFGRNGLDLLSFGVGFTDIDPFVLSILSGHYATVSSSQLAGAIVIAAGSNDLLKALYALSLGGRKQCGMVSGFLFLLGVLTMVSGLAISRLGL
ncbi:MAG TPA: DUF4010 domain-containing protein [Sedimenticola thiotaurini]|uniref:DUF4010 domain-containing protein n=1 Tax=Sedimenticola thiotaurini TaxID=1543721 RepID=A0A831RM44_9GAMM|nr:DUF4010 domain-containing protein [Sedimenticola thiotaurini]